MASDIVKSITTFIQKYGTKGHSGRKKAMVYRFFGEEPHRYVEIISDVIPWGYGVTPETKISEGSKNLSKAYRFFRSKNELDIARKIYQAYTLLNNGNIEQAENNLKEIKKYMQEKYPAPKETPQKVPKIGGGVYS